MKKENKRKVRRRIARALQLLSFRRGRKCPDDIRSIVILCPERFGDAILLTPLIRQLHRCLPKAKITLLAFRKSSLDFFQQDPLVDSIFYVKEGVVPWLSFVMFRSFDVLFTPKDMVSVNYLVQAFFVRARYKVAHANEYHRRIFDHLIEMDYYAHVTRRNCALFNALHLPADEDVCARPYLPPMPVREEIRDFAGTLEGQGYIGVNISASNTPKYWIEEKWERLLATFPDERFIVFSSPGSRDMARKARLEEQCPSVTMSPSTVNLGEVGCMMQKLKMMISLDTSLVHIASCYNLPVVAMYENDKAAPTRFRPLSTLQELVVSRDAMVSSIEVDSVAAAVRRMLDSLSGDSGSGA